MKKHEKTIILLLIISIISLSGCGIKKEEITAKAPKKVGTVLVSGINDQSEINTVGSVEPEAKVKISSTAQGNLKGLYFEIGDEVKVGDLLAVLYNSSSLTNLNNAKTNYVNTESSSNATERIAAENVNQAEIGVQNALEAIEAANITLLTTKNNLENAKNIKIKNNEDAKQTAIVAFNGHLNTIFSALDQVNYIIKAEGNLQIPGIETVLGVKNPPTVNDVKTSYHKAKEKYEYLKKLHPNEESITKAMQEMTFGLSLTENVVNKTVVVLDNTVSSIDFPQTTLSAQKSNFVSLRTAIVSAQASAENTKYNLENLYLYYNSEINALENAVKSAENQLKRAEIGYENALVSLESAKKGYEQQLISTGSAVDNARGQLNLAQTQVSDLYIRAPISGKITAKHVEIGAEINPGQVVAEIQQAKNLKIIVTLPGEDIYRINKEGEVRIGENQIAAISSISPAADPITKKVKVEILYDNTQEKLIPGTFINVSIPIKKYEKTTENSFFIPLSAVNITQSENYVFIVENNIAKKVNVKLGKSEGELIEVLEGLEENMVLILDGGKNLDNGERIEIINN